MYEPCDHKLSRYLSSPRISLSLLEMLPESVKELQPVGRHVFIPRAGLLLTNGDTFCRAECLLQESWVRKR